MISANIELIVIVSGIATMAAGLLVVAPKWGLAQLFGSTESHDPGVLTLASYWGLLVTLIGALVLAAAWMPELRVPVLIVAAIEKLALSMTVFFGAGSKPLLARRAAVTDTLFSILYPPVARQRLRPFDDDPSLLVFGIAGLAREPCSAQNCAGDRSEP